MRFATIRTDREHGETRAVRVDGETLVDVGFRDVGEMLASSPDAIPNAALASGRAASSATNRCRIGRFPHRSSTRASDAENRAEHPIDAD